MASISSLFGYVLNFIYGLVQNYGIAIIIFSVLLKLILLPLSIKQQKTMKKTAKIQEKVKELQEKYKNDQVKMNQEMMELYKKENMSPFSGCLSSILQIFILIAIFGLVRMPLTYMKKIDSETIQKYITEIRQELGEEYITGDMEDIKREKITGSKYPDISVGYPEISVLKYLNINDKKEDPLYINTEFFGLDLSNIPKDDWQKPSVYIIPILYVITSVVSMKISTSITNKNKKEDIIEIKNENKEEPKEMAPEDMTAQMSKSMTWFMPILSVSIVMVAPLGLALYWLVNNILMIAERLILNKFLKSEEEDQNG